MDEHLALLADEGCHGLELSASMVWSEPVETSYEELYQFKKKVYNYGLCIPSMHSLTYTRPDLNFFASEDSRRSLIEYIGALGRIASELECPLMVFGSSKSREIAQRDKQECFAIMAQSFRAMAQILQPLGVTLVIEPLSRMETDSIVSTDEGGALVNMVNHPNLKLHVDIKSSIAEHEDYERIWREYKDMIYHAHVSDLELRPPSDDVPDHKYVAQAMHNAGYNRYLSIEIGRRFGETTDVVRNAINYIKNTYL